MKKQADYLQQLLVKKFFGNHNALAVKKIFKLLYQTPFFTHPPPPRLYLGSLSVGGGEGGGGVKRHRGENNGRLLLF